MFPITVTDSGPCYTQWICTNVITKGANCQCIYFLLKWFHRNKMKIMLITAKEQKIYIRKGNVKISYYTNYPQCWATMQSFKTSEENQRESILWELKWTHSGYSKLANSSSVGIDHTSDRIYALPKPIISTHNATLDLTLNELSHFNSLTSQNDLQLHKNKPNTNNYTPTNAKSKSSL